MSDTDEFDEEAFDTFSYGDDWPDLIGPPELGAPCEIDPGAGSIKKD